MSERKSKQLKSTDRTERSTSVGMLQRSGAAINRAVQAGSRQVAENPLAAVAGAAAVSAGLALLFPTSRREAEVMGEVADKLGDVAREAVDGVVAAGRVEVESMAQTALAGVGASLVQALVPAGNGQGH